ncbi:MAG: division/cell wall cluster transcriptional repressor MraZ [Eubacteriaceae bacterium]|nr:division/cell wall cluster transcriptional repressor MraZ [Eubacteriaceae bacterium]
MDGKGRVSVPFRFRNEMGDVVVVSKGIGEKCLFIFPMPEWKKIEDKIRVLPISDAKAREVTRFFAGGSSEIEIDKQGRIMLPQYLRDYAGLDREVVIVGLVNRAEIWDVNVWNEKIGTNSEYYSNIEQDMKDLGI